MGSKAAGVLGGILCLMCAAGVFAMYQFVQAPANSNYAAAAGNMQFWMLDQHLNITGGILPWDTPIIPGLTLEDMILIDSTMKMAPVNSINFWNVITLDIWPICILLM